MVSSRFLILLLLLQGFTFAAATGFQHQDNDQIHHVIFKSAATWHKGAGWCSFIVRRPLGVEFLYHAGYMPGEVDMPW